MNFIKQESTSYSSETLDSQAVCSRILDLFYECSDNDSSSQAGINFLHIFNQMKIGFHTLFCSECAEKIELYNAARLIMKEDFLHSSPDLSSEKSWQYLEESIMTRIYSEEEQTETESSCNAPGVLSTRGWVIAGLILLVSLITAFFGLDFKNLASESGMSFMLPMGITIGIILTTYGAIFIGSHLKELSERFGL